MNPEIKNRIQNRRFIIEKSVENCVNIKIRRKQKTDVVKVNKVRWEKIIKTCKIKIASRS